MEQRLQPSDCIGMNIIMGTDVRVKFYILLLIARLVSIAEASSSSNGSYSISSSTHASGALTSSENYSHSAVVGDIGGYISSGTYDSHSGFVGVFVSGEITAGFSDWASSLIDNGIEGDSDKDGIANLVEYAFGLDPTTHNLITEKVNFDNEEEELVLRYAADVSINDIEYIVEYSDDLSLWETDGISEVIESSVGSIENRKASINKLGYNRRFMRINITLD